MNKLHKRIVLATGLVLCAVLAAWSAGAVGTLIPPTMPARSEPPAATVNGGLLAQSMPQI